MNPDPEERMRQATAHAESLRNKVIEILDTDAAEATRIRKASDRILSIADETHKHHLPTRSQMENWPTAHLDETRRHMMEAVKAWRSAAVAHGHAVDMYDIAEETDRKGEKADTRGLRVLAQSLRERAAQLVPIDTRYDTTALQVSAYACNEALDRINEKHALVCARLHDTATKLDDIADHYDTLPGKRPRTAHQRPR